MPQPDISKLTFQSLRKEDPSYDHASMTGASLYDPEGTTLSTKRASGGGGGGWVKFLLLPAAGIAFIVFAVIGTTQVVATVRAQGDNANLIAGKGLSPPPPRPPLPPRPPKPPPTAVADSPPPPSPRPPWTNVANQEFSFGLPPPPPNPSPPPPPLPPPPPPPPPSASPLPPPPPPFPPGGTVDGIDLEAEFAADPAGVHLCTPSPSNALVFDNEDPAAPAYKLLYSNGACQETYLAVSSWPPVRLQSELIPDAGASVSATFGVLSQPTGCAGATCTDHYLTVKDPTASNPERYCLAYYLTPATNLLNAYAGIQPSWPIFDHTGATYVASCVLAPQPSPPPPPPPPPSPPPPSPPPPLLPPFPARPRPRRRPRASRASSGRATPLTPAANDADATVQNAPKATACWPSTTPTPVRGVGWRHQIEEEMLSYSSVPLYGDRRLAEGRAAEWIAPRALARRPLKRLFRAQCRSERVRVRVRRHAAAAAAQSARAADTAGVPKVLDPHRGAHRGAGRGIRVPVRRARRNRVRGVQDQRLVQHRLGRRGVGVRPGVWRRPRGLLHAPGRRLQRG